jgi:hypothetical protein
LDVANQTVFRGRAQEDDLCLAMIPKEMRQLSEMFSGPPLGL